MTSKYVGLPDIDTAQDVFETADEPEHVLRPSEIGLEDDDAPTRITSEDIDSSGLPERRRAERVFGRGTRKPDPKLIFRPRLPPLARRRSSSSSSDEPLIETPAARLRRLKAELEEVEAEIQARPSSFVMGNGDAIDQGGREEGKRKSVLPPRLPIDLVAELGSLRSRLDAVEVRGGVIAASGSSEWTERLRDVGRQPVDGRGDRRDEEVAVATSATSGDGTSLSQIDKRLAMLEDTVGPADLDLADLSTPAPLLTTLNKLDHLLVLLTQPRHLDAISRRVKLLLVDLDRAAAASRRQPHAPPAEKGSTVTLSQAEYTSLHALFALLPRLDPLLPIIPPLLARLRSLSGLHAEAGQAVASLRRVQDGNKRMEGEVKELMGVAEGIKSGLEDAGQAVEKNWQGLEGRIRDLEERLKALS